MIPILSIQCLSVRQQPLVIARIGSVSYNAYIFVTINIG